MKRKISRTNRNYIIIGLCAILVIMGVGYAAFQSQLKISGTSNIGANFNVKITSITPNSIVGTALDKPEITKYNDTSATFGVSLKSPGDSITYDITIENRGTIDAILKTITKTDTNNSAILFETSGVEENDELKVGETATMKVKVTYNPEVTSQPTDLDSTLNVELDYEQSTGEVIPTPSNPTIGGQEVELVESGDGLYEDEYESGRLIYRGQNPNNYIEFNDELWRIIAKETDGTYKIIKDEDVGYMDFDENGNRLNANNSFCSDDTFGCSVFAPVSGEFSFPSKSYKGTVTEDSSIKIYLNEDYYVNNINEIAKKQMTSHSFNIGAVENLNLSGAEADSIAKNIAGEKMYQWTGNVGLANVTDILRASTNPSCTSATVSYEDDTACNDNYLFPYSDEYWWTINPYDNESVWIVVASYYGNTQSVRVSNETAGYDGSYASVKPVVFLKSDITLSGLGTKESPFTIVS